jgi:hypothetical protein
MHLANRSMRKKRYVITKAGMVEAKSGVHETRDPDISAPLGESLAE